LRVIDALKSPVTGRSCRCDVGGGNGCHRRVRRCLRCRELADRGEGHCHQIRNEIELEAHILRGEADKLGLIDTGKNVAIGYCAGGGYVLEQARAGADFKAVVVFHVTNPNPVVAGTPCNIKGRVLAIHGSADPVTPKPMMDAFEEEMTNAKIDWQVMMFGGAVHSFCDPTVHAGPTRYDEKLCRKSYMLMRDFFAETS